MRKARDALTKAMGRGGLGQAFTLREMGNSWRVLSRGVRSSKTITCLDSGCVLKVEPTESLVGPDTGCERKMS